MIDCISDFITKIEIPHLTSVSSLSKQKVRGSGRRGTGSHEAQQSSIRELKPGVID